MILFFEPIPRYTIWGGKACNTYFNCTDRFEDGVGQIWAFAAQENGSTVCSTAPYEGKTLADLWKTEPALFGCDTGRTFPLIISLVAPEDDLSLQVHPDATYAKEQLGLSMGKNEAWYFMKGTSIVYGLKTSDRAETQTLIDEGRWSDIPITRPMKDGEFVYIPAGMMHAMGKDNIVYEIQQSTDITYRFYDYDRVDKNGNKRPLDLNEAMDCLHYEEAPEAAEPVITTWENLVKTVFISNDSFTVTRLEVSGACAYSDTTYQLATVVVGEGTADGIAVRPGSSFLIPVGESVQLDGTMTIMMTTA